MRQRSNGLDDVAIAVVAGLLAWLIGCRAMLELRSRGELSVRNLEPTGQRVGLKAVAQAGPTA
jgi:hypothetical protein